MKNITNEADHIMHSMVPGQGQPGVVLARIEAADLIGCLTTRHLVPVGGRIGGCHSARPDTMASEEVTECT